VPLWERDAAGSRRHPPIASIAVMSPGESVMSKTTHHQVPVPTDQTSKVHGSNQALTDEVVPPKALSRGTVLHALPWALFEHVQCVHTPCNGQAHHADVSGSPCVCKPRPHLPSLAVVQLPLPFEVLLGAEVAEMAAVAETATVCLGNEVNAGLTGSSLVLEDLEFLDGQRFHLCVAFETEGKRGR